MLLTWRRFSGRENFTLTIVALVNSPWRKVRVIFLLAANFTAARVLPQNHQLLIFSKSIHNWLYIGQLRNFSLRSSTRSIKYRQDPFMRSAFLMNIAIIGRLARASRFDIWSKSALDRNAYKKRLCSLQYSSRDETERVSREVRSEEKRSRFRQLRESIKRNCEPSRRKWVVKQEVQCVKKRTYQIVCKRMSFCVDKRCQSDHVSWCFKYHVARRATINIT